MQGGTIQDEPWVYPVISRSSELGLGHEGCGWDGQCESWGSHCHRETPDVLTCKSFLSPDPGLTKEPVLWTLVSKEPPAPADETRHAGHDQGQEAGLSLNWAVPNVLLKDVPNFETISPALESGTSLLTCTRSPSRCPACRGWGLGSFPEGAHCLAEDRTHFF